MATKVNYYEPTGKLTIRTFINNLEETAEILKTELRKYREIYPDRKINEVLVVVFVR